MMVLWILLGTLFRFISLDSYKAAHATLQQLLVFFNTVIHSSFQTNAIYLDFRKAFDSVAHKELLHKRWNFGITDNLWLWVKAYLTGHNNNVFQLVNLCQTIFLLSLASYRLVYLVLYLLFLIFINDLPTSVLSSMVFLYADTVQ